MPAVPRVAQEEQEETTKRSRRGFAQAPRGRSTTLALLGAAGLIAAVTFATTHPWARPDLVVAATRAPAETLVGSPAAEEPFARAELLAAPEEPTRTRADEPTRTRLDEPAPTLADEPAPDEPPPEPPISFAPTTANPMTPTPLAAAATPLATAAPPVVLPAPTSTPARLVLPPGLPRTRDDNVLPYPTAPWPSPLSGTRASRR